MPELPEVETIKRDLEKKIVGQKIVQVLVYDRRVIRNSSSRGFIRNLTGKIVHGISRRGKALIVQFTDPGFLVVQPMMTGQLIYGVGISKKKFRHRLSGTPAAVARKKTSGLGPTKVTFRLSNHGYLNYNDQRLFGRLQFCRTLEEIKFFQDLGVEPFSPRLNVEWLAHELIRRATPIKNLLMNQKFIAGIGNIYASEILFVAGIHPQRAANTLNKEEIDSLLRKMEEVLNEAIRCRGTSMNTYRDADGQKGNYINRIKVYGREDQACLRCQTPIERFVQGGRSTFFCRHCQK